MLYISLSRALLSFIAIIFLWQLKARLKEESNSPPEESQNLFILAIFFMLSGSLVTSFGQYLLPHAYVSLIESILSIANTTSFFYVAGRLLNAPQYIARFCLRHNKRYPIYWGSFFLLLLLILFALRNPIFITSLLGFTLNLWMLPDIIYSMLVILMLTHSMGYSFYKYGFKDIWLPIFILSQFLLFIIQIGFLIDRTPEWILMASFACYSYLILSFIVLSTGWLYYFERKQEHLRARVSNDLLITINELTDSIKEFKNAKLFKEQPPEVVHQFRAMHKLLTDTLGKLGRLHQYNQDVFSLIPHNRSASNYEPDILQRKNKCDAIILRMENNIIERGELVFSELLDSIMKDGAKIRPQYIAIHITKKEYIFHSQLDHLDDLVEEKYGTYNNIYYKEISSLWP